MLQATVTVDYVNPPKPGKKMGSIKSTDGDYYGVWPDKLGLFEKGGTYKINYETSEAGFKNFKSLVSSEAPTTAKNGPTKSVEMAVMAIVGKAYEGTGSVPSQSELFNAMHAVKTAWEGAMEGKQPPALDDLSDEVPF